jgi:hypothetical protein
LVKKDCVECSGCPHGLVKQNCAKCSGCPHSKLKQYCAECSGCPHGKLKQDCTDCLSLEEMIAGGRFCLECFARLSTRRIRVGALLCQKHDGSTRRIENAVLDLLEDLVETPPSTRDDILTGGAGCGDEDDSIARRRADAAWIGHDDGTPIIIIAEVDENGGHPDRHSECDEAAKITDTFLAHRQILTRCKSITLRINPERYDGAPSISGHSLEARVALVAARIKELIAPGGMANLSETAPYVEYYYCHSACYKHIAYARDATALSLSVFGVFPVGAKGHFDRRGDDA